MLDEEGPTIECITTLCEGDSACYWTDIDPADCPSGATFTWTVNDANGNAVSFDGQGTAEICLQWDEGPFGEVSLAVTGCPGVCDQATTVQIPIISSSTLVTGPEIVCVGDVAVYTVPKWMDVVYDWTVTGGTIVSTNGNQVSVLWGSQGAGTVDVTYESPFLLGLKEHDAPDCSGEGHLPVEVLPKLQVHRQSHASLRGQHPDLRHQRHRTRLERDRPGLGNDHGRLLRCPFPRSRNVHRDRFRPEWRVLQPGNHHHRDRGRPAQPRHFRP